MPRPGWPSEREELLPSTDSRSSEATRVEELPRQQPCTAGALKAAAAAALIGVLCLVLAVAASRRVQPPGAAPSRVQEVDTAAVAGLQALPGTLVLTVGTSTRPFAQTNSPVTVAFSQPGGWSPEQELFKKAERGQEVQVASTFQVSEWPDAVMLRIHGNDGWGLRYVRLSLGGETRSLVDSANGADYGNNNFWLDGNQDVQQLRVFNVPKAASQPLVGRANSRRWLVPALLLLALAAAVAAYVFRVPLKRILGLGTSMPPPGMVPPGLAPPGMAPPGMAPAGMAPPGMAPPGRAPAVGSGPPLMTSRLPMNTPPQVLE